MLEEFKCGILVRLINFRAKFLLDIADRELCVLEGRASNFDRECCNHMSCSTGC
jgi:hypothetical protein